MGDPARISDLEYVFGRAIAAVIGLAGIAFFIMLLIGGFRFITAGADPKKAEAAKKTLTTAVTGLVLIALAYLILRVIATLTGAEGILEFVVTQP